MKHYIIPIFIPHYGCENECVFCNQHKITGVQTNVDAKQVINIILCWIERFTAKKTLIEVAFYGGSFTALSLEKQKELLDPVRMFLQKKIIHSIRISTRPDAIDESILENLIHYGVSIIELGVQSLDNDVLQKSARGHTKDDVLHAVNLIRKYSNFKLGLQIMPGLPGDSILKMLLTVKEIVRLEPDFIRIYPTIVLNNTKLAELYLAHRYSPLELEIAVNYCCTLKTIINDSKIAIIRMGLQATENLNDTTILAGPYHPAFGELVDARIFYLLIADFLEEIDAEFDQVSEIQLNIYHSYQLTSKIRGNRNQNIIKWQIRYPLFHFKFVSTKQAFNYIKIEYEGQIYTLNVRGRSTI